MSAVKTIDVMKRYELKYVLTKEQVAYIKSRLINHMEIDEYGRTSIASLYYDTPDCRLIRASIDNPEYKEKIRLRSYGLATNNSPLFLELKRKYDRIVYKRRVKTNQSQVDAFFSGKQIEGDKQISKGIAYFRDYYKNLVPICLIIYDREAYFEKDGDLRLTIDFNPRYRMKDLNLSTSMEGISLLNEGEAILEIKVQEAMPLWLTHILAEGNIKKSSFSKYGTAYKLETSKMLAVA